MLRMRYMLFTLFFTLFLTAGLPAMVHHHTMPQGSQKITKVPSNLPAGFVYLSDVDPTIQTSVRYATNDNFEGRPITGYHKPIIILTKKAALQLRKVQDQVRQNGYSLVVYDAYRPQKAVDDFVAWSRDAQDQACKERFYPRVNKKDVFKLGYVAYKSAHSRGSTVDITLIPLEKTLHAIQSTYRKMKDGSTLLFLDDGTLDMGSSFDLFDVASHYENKLIDRTYQQRRTYLKEVMDQFGFINYSEEWWHFTLRDEPYPATTFNFTVQ